MRLRRLVVFLVSIFWLASLSCGGEDNPQAESASLTINLLPSAVEGLLNSTRLPVGPLALSAPPAVAQTTESSLTSLQYFVREIQLCEDLVIEGTGYSHPTGCITLYQTADTSAQNETFYNQYTITDALNDTNEDHFIDFLSAAGQAKLASTPVTLTSSMIGSYHYGKIDYMRPIRMTAEFKNTSGESLFYTKTPSLSEIHDEGTNESGMEEETLRLSDTTSSPAELMTYMLNNGGTWFPFLQPFQITQADIDQQEEITVDFVFNPHGFATASQAEICTPEPSGSPAVYDGTHCVSFDLPYAQLSPVPRRAGEATMKEVYWVDYDSGSRASQLRVEVYFNDHDEAKSVQGVGLAVLMDATATESAGNVIQAYQVEESDAGLTFYGWNENTGDIDAISLTGLQRETSGTLTLQCNFVGGPCAAADGSSLARDYTYEGVATVSN